MPPQVTVTEQIGAVAGEAIALAIHATVAARGRCCLALSGGSSPGPVMEWLAEHLSTTLVQRLVVTWVDERHLPISSEVEEAGVEGAGGEGPGAEGSGFDWRALPEASNLRLAWAHWFSRISELPTLVPMARPGSLDEAVRGYTADFAERVQRVDVALLGAGPDGHIASLFPGHPALDATGVCVAVEDSPKPPPLRLSLTMPVLQDVDHAVLVASGSAKASMLQQAHTGQPELPLGRYRPAGAWRWVLDPAAAALIEDVRMS
ncbi:MAG: 6-phosphogluconolactonase [Myxococcota bacterium]